MTRSVGESAKDRWVLFGARVDVLEPDPDVVEESTDPTEDGVDEGEDQTQTPGKLGQLNHQSTFPGLLAIPRHPWLLR